MHADSTTAVSADLACCSNCGATLSGPYCAACGQKVRPRVTLRSIAIEGLARVADLDEAGDLMSTIRDLVVRPGTVIRDWNRGRTKPYVGPFSVLTIAFAVAAFTGIQSGGFRGGGGPLAGQITFLVALPCLLGLLGRLVFLRGPRNLAEHLVANAYLVAIDLLIASTVFLAIWAHAPGTRIVSNVALLIMLASHVRGLAQAAGGHWRGWAGALATFLLVSIAFWSVMTFGLGGLLAVIRRVH